MPPHFQVTSRFIVFLLAFSLGDPRTAAAAAEKEASNTSDSMSWLGHLGRDLAAPVLNPGRVYFIAGSVLTLSTLPLRKPALVIGQDKPLKSTSSIGYRLGFWPINVAYVGAFLAYGLIAEDSVALQRSMLMLRATAYTGLVTTALKGLHLEERPRNDGDYNSFPSGHASNAFAFAGVVYRNHGVGFGIPAFAMASFVAFSRMNDNAHYLNDVLFGGTLGLSYALGLDTSWSSKDETRTATLVPLIDSRSMGLGALFEF